MLNWKVPKRFQHLKARLSAHNKISTRTRELVDLELNIVGCSILISGETLK